MGRRPRGARAYLVELPSATAAAGSLCEAVGPGGQVGPATWLLRAASRAAVLAQLQALGLTATRLAVAAPGIYRQVAETGPPAPAVFLVLWPDGRLEATRAPSPLATAVLALRAWLAHDFVAADRLLAGDGDARACFRQLIEHRLREQQPD